MTTLLQIVKKKRKVKVRKRRRLALAGCPQKKATCLKVYTMSTRKPNSALRKIS
jgi:small subunit ribosomal protein S12